ncbi:MAG: GNAT family acetyltransferase [Oculatellaceae cyanobacterium bins.114]|nr:GNAT family acetyltransferase [Oculatellaceae cyanobacterium bins.114]
MIIRVFDPADESAVIALWQQCGLTRPWNDPHKDIQRKRQIQPHLFLVGVAESAIAATVMAGYDGHRGWINYLAVAPQYQRQGFGKTMLAEAEQRLCEMGCPKISLLVRSSNREVIEFYQRLGFTLDDAVSLGKRLEHDDR